MGRVAAALFVRAVGADAPGLGVDECADAAGAEVVDDAVAASDAQRRVEEPHTAVCQNDRRDAQGVDRLRMDARQLLPLLDDLLKDRAVRAVGGVCGLGVGVVRDRLGVHALAEGGVDGLDDVARVRLRKIAQGLEGGGRRLRAFFDAQHIAAVKVAELLVREVLVFEYVRVFRIVHARVVAHADALRDEPVPVGGILSLIAEEEVFIIVRAIAKQAPDHVAPQTVQALFVAQYIHAAVLGDGLVQIPPLAVVVVCLAVPGLKTDLSVDFAPQFFQHGDHAPFAGIFSLILVQAAIHRMYDGLNKAGFFTFS